jgi:hypothetical protein
VEEPRVGVRQVPVVVRELQEQEVEVVVLQPLGEAEVVEVLLHLGEEEEVVDQLCQVVEEEVEAQVNLAEEGEVEDKHLVVVGVLEVVLILLMAEEVVEEE